MCGRPAPHQSTRHLNGENTLLNSYLIVSRKMGRRLKNHNMATYERFVLRGSLSVVPSFFEHEPLRYEASRSATRGIKT